MSNHNVKPNVTADIAVYGNLFLKNKGSYSIHESVQVRSYKEKKY